jgi:prevent-host-death family protein
MTMNKEVDEISISEFKAKCLGLLEQVRLTRKPLRVTKFGKPIADIVPATAVRDRASLIGSMRDSFDILGDIVSPANDPNEWEALRD